VKIDLVLKGRPGKLAHLQYIVKKFNEVIRIPDELLFSWRIRSSRKLITNDECNRQTV
jgi:hypothetical protein